MASPAFVVREDGSIEATPELRQQLQLMPGTRLELVGQDGQVLRFRAPVQMKAITSWRDLEGILANSAADPNQDLEQERISELNRDEP